MGIRASLFICRIAVRLPKGPQLHPTAPKPGASGTPQFASELLDADTTSVAVLRLTTYMLNHPMVQKDYVFTANFAQQFRYNEQALVYSGLLARNTAFSGGSAGMAK